MQSKKGIFTVFRKLKTPTELFDSKVSGKIMTALKHRPCVWRAAAARREGIPGMCHCGLTSSAMPESFTDSTAIYNVPGTSTMTAVNSRSTTSVHSTFKHKWSVVTFFDPR